MVIPTSTWATVLGEHIVSLKLNFASKRIHDPKGFLNSHFKKYHIKIAYAHEELPDDSIYQGVNTFSEVLAKAKSKDEKSHILQNQKELKERIQSYRAMQMDLLEKMRKDREEKESHTTKFPSVATHTNGDKGKGLMGYLPEATIS